MYFTLAFNNHCAIKDRQLIHTFCEISYPALHVNTVQYGNIKWINVEMSYY